MIKAIETEYNGYLFRSRLEARWAVFFDTLGIKWEYEKEGYKLNGIWYLPDFWLPIQKRWIEIKGQKPTSEELTKVERLESGTGYPSCIFYSLPGEYDGYAYYTCAHDSGNAGKSFSDNVKWRECAFCLMIDVNIRCHDGCSLYSELNGIELDSYSCSCSLQSYKEWLRQMILKGGSMRLCGKSLEKDEFEARTEVFITELIRDHYPYGLAVTGVDILCSRIAYANIAARQARFEHGERP